MKNTYQAKRQTCIRAMKLGKPWNLLLVATIQAGVQRMDAKRPEPDEIASAFQELCKVSAWKAGRFEPTVNPRKGISDGARCLHKILKWHRSGGNLHGLFAAQFEFGTDACDRWDTVAQVYLFTIGRNSSAVAAWKETGIV